MLRQRQEGFPVPFRPAYFRLLGVPNWVAILYRRTLRALRSRSILVGYRVEIDFFSLATSISG